VKFLHVVIGVVVASLLASPAAAQLPRKLPVAVLDIRGFYSKLGQDPTTAADLGLESADLPSRGLGGVAGLHLYPLRFENMALGIGAEGILARGHHEIGSDDGEGLETGDSILTQPVDQRLRGLAGVISINFGHREGWSYLTAGLGPMTFITYPGGTRPAEAPPVSNTLTFGGGARWFMKPHLAFTFDLRFYQTRPELQTASYPRRQRSKLLIMSAGVSIK
jgi:hypothetical protein